MSNVKPFGHGKTWAICCKHLIENPKQEWVQHGCDYLCKNCDPENPIIDDLEPLAMDSINGLRRKRA